MKSVSIAVFFIVALGLGTCSVHAADEATPSPVPATATAAPVDVATMSRAKEWLHRIQIGDLDRSQLTAKMNSSFTPALVTQAAAQLGPLGDPTSFTFVSSQVNVNSSTTYVYRAVFKPVTLNEIFVLDKSGKIDGIFFKPAK